MVLNSSVSLFATLVVCLGYVVASPSCRSDLQGNQDADGSSDRSWLLQLPDLRVEPAALGISPDVEALSQWMIKDVPENLKPHHIMTDGFKLAMNRKGNREGDLSAFMMSLACNACMLSMLVITFSLLAPLYPRVYCDNAGKRMKSLLGGDESETYQVPPEGWVGWIRSSWNLSNEEIQAMSGLDAALFIEFQNLALRLLVRIGIPLVSLCPLHYFFGGSSTVGDNLSKLGMNNIANEPERQWLYWIHAVLVWWVCFSVVREVFRAQEWFVGKRYAWLSHMPRPRSTTVLVEGIPRDAVVDGIVKDYCSDKHVKDYFCELFSESKIKNVHVVKKTYRLQNAVNEYNSFKQSLDDAEAEWKLSGGTEDTKPKMRESCNCTEFASTIDTIEYYKRQLVHAAGKVKLERERLEVCTSNAFVTFRDERDAALALCL
jgi:hypothetical protein